MIGRPVDPSILDHMTRTEQGVAEYQRLEENRSWLQVAFAWIFAIVAVMVLLVAVLIGLLLANQIARPIGRLIHAAERVRGGDLGVRVTEAQTGDELAGLSRAFNRMTGQLSAQRGELMDAYSQIDERRRFT
jgi:two-component system, NtrC family, nitrogen regulation sensor histidine kinase NtrY